MFNCIRPFKFHNWDKWETIAAGKMYNAGSVAAELKDGNGDLLHSADYIRQQRTCKDCGAIELRTVRS